MHKNIRINNRGIKVNSYNDIYNIKEYIEKNISKNKLFKLKLDDAILVVLEKAGVLNSSLNTIDEFEQKQLINNICKLEIEDINIISFIQESIKWIFRWCSSYCSDSATYKAENVKFNDVCELMGIAYSYEKFYDMWEMHNYKKVNYNREDNKLNFEYKNEDTYKIHLFYDTICRMIDNGRLEDKLNNMEISQENLTEIMNHVHELDFDCCFDIEFDGFNLKEYKSFSKAINEIICEYMEGNSYYNARLIIPGDTGVVCMFRTQLIESLYEMTSINREKINKMINFFTYDFLDQKSDISLTYIVPISTDKIIISEPIFNFQRPEVNAMRLLAKRESQNYDLAQNNFEDQERLKIQKGINKRYVVGYGKEKSLKNIPGMDLLVYDVISNNLQVIELKYKIPIDSARDINNLDKMLEKAYKQIEQAKKHVENNLPNILKDYFGECYNGLTPNKIDYFILTNYSIGTGIGKKLPTKILQINHYIDLMTNYNGMDMIRNIINDKSKMLDIIERKLYDRVHIFEYDILIPNYGFKLKRI